ncbi:MAG TPA: BsaA family SipW-dependent biofilm matrix protein [Clostridiales bacterium]|nr:BsaA family SipW-dependent biofilm matrix protein [Clostridiales bacterium]
MSKLKKSLPAIALALVLLVTAIGGTFAYFSQTDVAENYIKVKDYNSQLTEEFDPPPDGLAPEIEVSKVVGVTNTGEIPMIVRITYTEFWDAVENAGLVQEEAVAGVYDGDTETDSVVRKYAGSGWVYGGDGYYYFMSILAPGASTGSWITGIELKDSSVVTTTLYDVTYWDGAAFQTVTGLSEAAKDALIAGLVDPAYVSQIITNTTSVNTSGNDYMLRITTETLQAIAEAAATWTPTTPAVQAFLASV